MEPATPGALAVLALALEHSGRLGHRYLGGEHLLLAVASSGQPAGVLLRERGVTPQRVEEQIARLAGHGAGAALFSSLDRDALAAIGIDLGAVRARIESSFEVDALARAGRAAWRDARPARLNLPRLRDMPAWLMARWHRRRDMAAWLMARWHRRRAAAGEPIPLRAATGAWRHHDRAPVFIPFTPSAREFWENVRHEAQAQHAPAPGTEHVALATIAMDDGLVPPILSALGVSAPSLRAAILDRCQQAS